jgi:hypothetical protein
MITTILIGVLCDLLQKELFFTVCLIVQARKQTTASNSALYCDMVSISVHSNVFIVFLMTVAVSQSEGDWVMNWKGVRNLVWPNWSYCLPVMLRETIQAHHNIQCPGTSSEATSSSASQETPHILWNVVVHSCVHKSPLLFPILSQLKPVHALPAYLFEIITEWCNCECGDGWRQCDSSSSSSACITMLWTSM